jgi:hypothetical protein
MMAAMGGNQWVRFFIYPVCGRIFLWQDRNESPEHKIRGFLIFHRINFPACDFFPVPSQAIFLTGNNK